MHAHHLKHVEFAVILHWTCKPPQFARACRQSNLSLTPACVWIPPCVATQALAARLGTSVSALYSGGAAHALDALLPAPFTRVHHLWYKDAAQIMPTVAGTAQAAPPPPHSCRSGLPVCLPATSFMGLPEQQVCVQKLWTTDYGGVVAAG
jgi:hypothetical protein